MRCAIGRNLQSFFIGAQKVVLAKEITKRVLSKLQKRKSTVTLELPVKQLIYALTTHQKWVKRIFLCLPY